MGVVVAIGVYHWEEVEIPPIKIPKSTYNSVFIYMSYFLIIINI